MALLRPEGKTLSSTDTVENNPGPVTAEEQHTHTEHDHEHDHAHDHHHGPVLNPECTRELVLDIPAEDVSKSFRNVVRNYQKYAKLPGFRPGKVPESVVTPAICDRDPQRSHRRTAPERFNKGVQDLGIKPVGQPQVTELTIDEGQPLHVKAVFEYLPEFSIEGYQGVRCREAFCRGH